MFGSGALGDILLYIVPILVNKNVCWKNWFCLKFKVQMSVRSEALNVVF